MTRNSSIAALLFGGLIVGLVVVALAGHGALAAIAEGDQVAVNPKAAGGLKKAPTGKSSLVTLSEADWDQILLGEWMVEL